MAASTSADSYDVFINHRGADQKDTFASHLYFRLTSNGLRVFLDREELRSGEYSIGQVVDAITTASVHVSIFSPRYAQSSWCLSELVLMLESTAPVIPVFHNVEPADLRWSRDGVYARSLEQLERKRTVDSNPRYDSPTIERWRRALSAVADFSGFVLRNFNGDEVELVDEVVKSVLRSSKTRPAKHVIGLDEKVEDFENKVFFGSAKPQVVGIVGVGGVGKTTLARELFDRKKQNYSRFCFLSNVRENARLGILDSLQRKLLKSLTGKDALINSIAGGKEALKEHLSSCRGVLMIIDDVDQLNHIRALFPVRSGLLSDSLVVITSRDENVIRSSGVENAAIYQLTGLNHQHSQQLFCAYSFNQPNPIQGFHSLVDNFLKALKGLPLFLRVFGALLSGNNYNRLYWEQQLDRLQRIPPGETQEILQISYDSLDEEAKQMFLDTACFFIGQKRDTAIRTWEGSGWDGRSGFVTLLYKCLLELDSENNIEMHDHLRDFGRALANDSLPRRLLHSTATIKDMLEQLSGTDVRGIKMVLGEDNDDVDVLGAIDVRTLELLDTENGILERLLRRPEEHVPRRLIWLRWNRCPTRSLPTWLPMESLRVLQVSGSELQTLWEDESQAPNLELRELEINAPLSNIPGSIGRLKNLERFVVGKYLFGPVNLTNLPEEFCHLQSLKVLVLTDCSKLKALPDSFDCLGGLQHIDLSFCSNLEMLPSSFRFLSQLRHINLSDCHDLMMLPNYSGYLTGLQHIDMRGCHNLERLPDFLEDLRHINLSGCHDLQRLPDSFGELIYLQHIDLQACHNLEKLPDSFGHLKNLEHINLSNCHNLKRMPESFGSLSNLQRIDLSGCHNLERLPNNFRNLKKLKYLDVEGCSNLILDRSEIIEILDNLPVAHRSQLEQLYE